MYRIALFQNQSEMEHYSYADARFLLRDLGYEIELVTGSHLTRVSRALDETDGIVFASNALNDRRLLTHLRNPTIRDRVEAYLASGRGILILHQLGLATSRDPTLGGLVASLDEVRAEKRPAVESAIAGTAVIPSEATHHVALVHPNRILHVPDEVLNPGPARPHGIYWHYWSGVGADSWEVLLADPSSGDHRPLLALSRKEATGRVGLCSIPLDWMGANELLHNLLDYVVRGRCATALLGSEAKSLGFEYIAALLSASKTPHHRYQTSESLDMLVTGVDHRVHTQLVLGPSVDRSDLPDDLSKAVDAAVDAGSLRLIDIDATSSKGRQFTVVSHDRQALRTLKHTEFSIRNELRTGFVQQSFWTTMECLTVLDETAGSRSLTPQDVEASLAAAKVHDRKGSYDDTFAATCAYFWLQDIAGDESGALGAAKWVRARLPTQADRDRCIWYLYAHRAGALTNHEKSEALRMLDAVQDDASEVDQVPFLRLALALDDHNSGVRIGTALSRNLIASDPPSISTSAVAARLLTEIHLRGIDDQKDASILERAIFEAVGRIHGSLASGGRRQQYPWEGRADTTVKALAALIAFDDGLRLPADEVMETVTAKGHVADAHGLVEQASAVLSDLHTANVQLNSEVARLLVATKRVVPVGRQRWWLAAAVAVLTYLLLTVSIVAFFVRTDGIETLKMAFVDSLETHAVVLAIISTIGGFAALLRRRTRGPKDIDSP